jgi:hypothetical protein
MFCWTVTQGSAFRATLGVGTESRWDSRMGINVWCSSHMQRKRENDSSRRCDNPNRKYVATPGRRKKDTRAMPTRFVASHCDKRQLHKSASHPEAAGANHVTVRIHSMKVSREPSQPEAERCQTHVVAACFPKTESIADRIRRNRRRESSRAVLDLRATFSFSHAHSLKHPHY